jgi:hypothetical protein
MSDRDFVQEYNDFIDECNPIIKIGTMEFYPSRVLEECDPVAYTMGLYEFMDALGLDRDCANY